MAKVRVSEAVTSTEEFAGGKLFLQRVVKRRGVRRTEGGGDGWQGEGVARRQLAPLRRPLPLRIGSIAVHIRHAACQQSGRKDPSVPRPAVCGRSWNVRTRTPPSSLQLRSASMAAQVGLQAEQPLRSLS